VLKLLMMLGVFLFVALALLALRQHERELNAQVVVIYSAILDRQDTLKDQNVQVALPTSPTALTAALQRSGYDTGDALRARNTQIGRPANAPVVPTVETDLVAPLLSDGTGHANPARPH
jgi:hypothetical protein